MITAVVLVAITLYLQKRNNFKTTKVRMILHILVIALCLFSVAQIKIMNAQKQTQSSNEQTFVNACVIEFQPTVKSATDDQTINMTN